MLDEDAGVAASIRIVNPRNLSKADFVQSGKMCIRDRYATADLAAGDYILSSKLSAVPAAENAYLYNLDGKKQAISVTIKSFATRCV